jgi:hypothetical protein
VTRSWREALLTTGLPVIAIVLLFFFGAHAAVNGFAILTCLFAALTSLLRSAGGPGWPASPASRDALYFLFALPATALTLESLIWGLSGIDPLKFLQGLLH